MSDLLIELSKGCHIAPAQITRIVYCEDPEDSKIAKAIVHTVDGNATFVDLSGEFPETNYKCLIDRLNSPSKKEGE